VKMVHLLRINHDGGGVDGKESQGMEAQSIHRRDLKRFP
jgi:hypothetical protein